MTSTTIQSTSLYFTEGNSDKEYHAAIEPKDEGYIVTFAYGRRGNTLTVGAKTPHPVSLAEATAIHNKLVQSKLAKGYQYGIRGYQPARQSGNEGSDSGIRCQLLNPIEESDVSRLLNSRSHCLQEKHDGRRLLVRKQGEEITGINRRGLVVAVPEPIRLAVDQIPGDVLIDGEAVGDTLHAFDLLELGGSDLRTVRYIDRIVRLQSILPKKPGAIRSVDTYVPSGDKLRVFEELRSAHREGVVFKDMNAPYSPGRPNSGGTQLKFKFVETASFVITGINAKRSVTLGLYDGDKLVPAGNVTIPPNHKIPEVGEVCEAKYLYCHKESGCIYQPVYLGTRDDIPAAECTVDQLKYKPQADAA